MIRCMCASLSRRWVKTPLAKAGVFVVAYRLKNTRTLPACDHQELLEILDWFDLNLEAPVRFNRSPRPNRKRKAISWFKPSATEHIRKARGLARIMDKHDIWVRL